MDWHRIWQRLRPGPELPQLERYHDIEPWAAHAGFYTATREFPAEPGPVPFLIRVVSASDAELATRMMFLAHRHAKLESPYLPRVCELGIGDRWRYMALHIEPPVRLLAHVPVDGMVVFRHVAEALSYLHAQGVAYRAVSADSIAIAGSGLPVLFDLWWTARFHADRMVPPVTARRPLRTCDPPEASEEYDGVRGDVYGLGVLAGEIGVPEEHHSLVSRMVSSSAPERPASMDAVLRELAL